MNTGWIYYTLTFFSSVDFFVLHFEINCCHKIRPSSKAIRLFFSLRVANKLSTVKDLVTLARVVEVGVSLADNYCSRPANSLKSQWVLKSILK